MFCAETPHSETDYFESALAFMVRLDTIWMRGAVSSGTLSFCESHSVTQ
jgi:hypothetical protein